MSTSNSNLPSVRRILKELAQLNSDNSLDYKVHLVEDQLFELHFTIRGPPDSPYAKGRYHGKLILPHDYPFRPPEIVFLTPSGRFEVNKKICLSVTNYHPESWQPAWGIRTFLIGISTFMAVESAEAIGSMQWTSEERQLAAEKSNHWRCPDCKQTNVELLPESSTVSTSTTMTSTLPNSTSESLHFDYVDSIQMKKNPTSSSSSSTTSSSSSSSSSSSTPSPTTTTSSTTSSFFPSTELNSIQPHPSTSLSPPPPSSSSSSSSSSTPTLQTQSDINHLRTQRARLDFLIVTLILIILALLFK